jgi:hypothetical protein
MHCKLFHSLTFCSYPKVAISKHFTVNQAEALIEAQSLIEPLNRHFWVGVVSGCPSSVIHFNDNHYFA